MAMSCAEFDWKGYALEEAPAEERRRMEEHLASCTACREELEGVRLTVAALRRLPAREMPRRISFVSDPVFEPNWWQRLWSSGPQLGFASAAVLALAILAHGYIATPRVVQAPAVQAEVDRQVAAKMDAALKPALAEMTARVEELRKTSEEHRLADQKAIDSAFDLLEKRVNARVLTAARYGGD